MLLYSPWEFHPRESTMHRVDSGTSSVGQVGVGGLCGDTLDQSAVSVVEHS